MVAPLREVALLTNPTAGRGRAARARDRALAAMDQAGLRVRTLQGPDGVAAAELARTAVAAGVDALVVCGGDGMVQLGAEAVAGTGTPLGIVPAGTGNDVARALGLPRGDAAAAARVVVHARTRTVDLARCRSAGPGPPRDTDRLFVTVLAAGFDALVNERADRMSRPRGQARYTLATLLELRALDPVDYALVLDGRARDVDATLVTVGNTDSYGGGLRITEGARVDDGLLDVVVIRPMSRRRLVRLYPELFRGTHVTAPEYEHHRVRTVSLTTPRRRVVAYADGERVGALPLTVDVRPRALEVLA